MHSGVSNRGVKFKYVVGEKVLCYEPDPAKAKVLYESKVMEHIVTKVNGRSRPEYMVHFYGWSTTWDRCVQEEWVLPMTEENRDLQRRLAEEAAVFLKGRSRLPAIFKEALVKHNKVVEKKEPVSEPGSSSDSSEDEAEKEVKISIPEVLKSQLEEDCRCITKKNKLVAIPSCPNVVAILEGFVKHSAAKMLCESPPRNGKHLIPDDVQEKLGLYKEAADGLRVSFDSTLPHLLLYGQEKKQHYSRCSTARPHRDHRDPAPSSLKVEPTTSEAESAAAWEPIVIKQEPLSPKSPPKRGRPRLSKDCPVARRNNSPAAKVTVDTDSAVAKATAVVKETDCPVARRNKSPAAKVTVDMDSTVAKATAVVKETDSLVARRNKSPAAKITMDTDSSVAKATAVVKEMDCLVARRNKFPVVTETDNFVANATAVVKETDSSVARRNKYPVAKVTMETDSTVARTTSVVKGTDCSVVHSDAVAVETDSSVARRSGSRNKSTTSTVVKATTGKKRGVESDVDGTENQKVQTIIKRKKGRPKLFPARILRSTPVNSDLLPANKNPPSTCKKPPKRKCTLPQPISIKTEPGTSLCEDRTTRRRSVHARTATDNHSALKSNFCSSEALECPLSPSSLITSCSTLKVGSSGSSGASRIRGILEDTVAWKMLPDSVWEVVPAEPSLIYGAQHLLRLFVKLPDLISKMRIPNRKLQLLLDILNQFLAYMCEQQERLFPPSAYVDCPFDQ